MSRRPATEAKAKGTTETMAMRFVMIDAPDGLARMGDLRQTLLVAEDDKALAARPSLTAPLVGRRLAEVERDLILDTLAHCLGNRTQSAAVLGISIRTLRNKLKLYSEAGVEVPAPGEGGPNPASSQD